MISIIALATAPIWIGRFEESAALPRPWALVRLDRKVPPTRYRIARIAGVPAVEAKAERSMALLARPIAVDLGATPVLCWRWYVEAPVAGADLRRKRGDDYAARVYVAFDMPTSALSAGTRLKLSLAKRLYGVEVPDAALNYVWDSRYPIGTRAKSAFTDRAEMIVMQTGRAQAGGWVTERADVAADFARAFGGAPGRPVQLAVASDTDQTGGTARAGFADLHFVARDQPCLTTGSP